MEKLPREFYERSPLIVAEELLGKYLVHNNDDNMLTGKIVEVEAYMGPHDKAAHSYNNRRTERNEVMYGPGGYAYVFVIYGMYNCMNIVTQNMNEPTAVLIRALEPVSGLNQMARNRYGKNYNELTKSKIVSLTNGPGKLCLAMKIDKTNYGDDMCGNRLFVCTGSESDKLQIVTSPRINIDYAEEAIHYPWRYYIRGNPYVSKPHI